MKTRYTFSRICKVTLAVIVAGFALATLSCEGDVPAEGCRLFYNLAWSSFQILRPAILAVWQSVPRYICCDPTSLQHLLQIVASIWPLAGIMAG
jgi:hypothetical protein